MKKPKNLDNDNDQIKMNETSTTTVNNLSLIQSSNNNNMPLNDDNVDHATTTNKQNRSLIDSEIELLSPLDIRKFINDQSRRIFLFYQDILLEKQSKMINLKQMIEQFHYDHYPITSQKLLLFDLCKEKIIEIFSMDLSTNQSTDNEKSRRTNNNIDYTVFYKNLNIINYPIMKINNNNKY
ncbi:hypothetical protein DERP_005516 [Dermatophagoides pteronyssinus]|uniref:Uncharacterized protein n=1 Tax=Dermatophagoides pteronyssinus TaxID=6956 RepID=A0ABQ8JMT3_DERPT|nr:hypothetical protein DERP_005516 [Dermatophagoides pteronyssinus]